MKRTLIMISCLAVALGILAASAAVAWKVQQHRRTFYTDGGSIKVPLKQAQLRQILWQPAEALQPSINSDAQEYEAKLSPDGLRLYFVRGKPGTNADIFVCHRDARSAQQWSDPEALAAINTTHDELGPEPSADGNFLFFYSDRSGGQGGYDLWVSRRAESGWEPPVNLGEEVNSEFNEYSPACSPDGLLLYFASNRPQPGDEPQRAGGRWPATVRETPHNRDYDLYRSIISDGHVQPPAPLAELNTPANEGAPSISPVGDFIYFSSDRHGGRGGFDLYRARILRGQILQSENLGDQVNSIDNELDPALCMDGFGLHFSSDRRDEAAPGAGTIRDYNIYYTASREVFIDIDPGDPLGDLASLWQAIAPSLLWLLLALLALLLLLALLKRARSPQLSLLARCLLASLIAHLALMILLTFWQVTTSLAEAFDRGGTKVHLVSNTVASDLAAQVRGKLSEVAIQHEQIATERSHAEVALQQPSPSVDLPAQASQPPRIEQHMAEMIDHDSQTHEQPSLEIALASPSAPPVQVPKAELAAPSEAQQERSVEAALAAPDSILANTSPDRSSAAIPTALADSNRSAVALAPAKTESNSLDAAQSLASEIATRESSPATAEPPAIPVAAAAVAPAPAPSIALRNPPASDAAPQAGAEPAAQAPAITTHVARQVADSAAPLEAPSPSVVQFTPTPRTDSAMHEPGVRIDHTSQTDAPLPRLASAPDPLPQRPAPPALPMPPEAAALSAANLATPPSEAEHANDSSAESSLQIAAAPAPATSQSIHAPHSAIAAAPSDSPLQLPMQTSSPQAIEPLGQAAAPAALNQSARDLPAPELPAIALTNVDHVALPSPESAALALPATQLKSHDQPSTEPAAKIHIASANPASSKAPLDLPPLAAPAAQTVHLAPHQPVPPPAPRQLASLDQRRIADTLQPASSSSSPSSTTPAPAPPASAIKPIDLAAVSIGDLKLPTEVAPPADPFVQRSQEYRQEVVEKMGGSEATERAVELALKWFAAHQNEDGRWAAKGFEDNCGECGGRAKFDTDIATTGLALLCFLAADHTHQKDGPYRDNVARGIAWLLSQRSHSGDLRAGETMYSHAIAAIALCEAYGMTRDPQLRDPIQGALDFIDSARHEKNAGWRYEPGQYGDTSVLGWQAMALYSGRRAGLHVGDEVWVAATHWLDLVAAPSRPGLYSYQPGQRFTPSMTAEAMFCQQLVGLKPTEARMQQSAEYLLENLPRWHREANTYYWYYGTLAMYQHQGEAWEKWNRALVDQLLENQRTTGAAAGSWDPLDNWAKIGGRVYQTAICTLSLEVYYRYLPLYVAIREQGGEDRTP